MYIHHESKNYSPSQLYLNHKFTFSKYHEPITTRVLFSSSLSERTKVWGRALIVSPISATRWGAGRLRMPTTRPRWEKKRRFAFSPTGCSPSSSPASGAFSLEGDLSHEHHTRHSL